MVQRVALATVFFLHALQGKGIRVPRSLVEEIVPELDPDGVETRKAHKVR